MKINDTSIVILKGENAKKYFLERITADKGIRFKEIPEGDITLEERGSSVETTEIFRDLLERKLLEEVEFKTGEYEKKTELKKEKRHEEAEKTEIKEEKGQEEEAEKEKKEEIIKPSKAKKRKASKGLGDSQRAILDYLKDHEAGRTINDMIQDTIHSKCRLRQILQSLMGRKLIERKKVDKVYVYFCINRTAEKSAEAEAVQADETDDNQFNATAESKEEETKQAEESSEVSKKEEAKSETPIKSEESSKSEKVINALAIEQRRKEAITKQSSETKRIVNLFVKPKYRHVLHEIFKDNSFSVEAIRRKSDFADAKALTEVISALAGEAIQYDTNTEGTYIVDNLWRTYALVRLGKKDLKEEYPNELMINRLLDKGLIFEKENQEYDIIR